MAGLEPAELEPNPKVESIIIDTSNTRRPFGYYHIIKCYNYERNDMWMIANLDLTDFSFDEVVTIAKTMTAKFNCPLRVESLKAT
jgi:hypothetical protein